MRRSWWTFPTSPCSGRRRGFCSRAACSPPGLRYEGADFHFEPPQYAAFPLPSVAVIGTGKRVGKTAVTGHVARVLARDRKVVVVAMGRGGPAEPVLRDVQPTLDSLLELSRSGGHAASDYLETAALTGVVTVGCRRAGGGLAGAVMTSNVLQGAALAAEQDPDVVVFDGSGAAIPPIDADARVLVSGTGHDPTGYLNAYRVLVSDLVVLLGDVDPAPVRALKEVPVIRVDLRLRPVAPLTGRVAVFTTGPAPIDHLDAEIVSVSRNLADRTKLRADLAETDADVYLVEIKAAAIDVVAEVARERGVEVVFAENEVVPRPRRADPGRGDPQAGRNGRARMSHPRHSEPLPLGSPDQPYSKGLMARALVAVGVPLSRAYELAKRVELDLYDRAEQSIEFERLEELALEVLGDVEGAEATRRLRRLGELQELDLPIILLVGGATGTGKSTVATEAAYRLGITRVTSTDFVRQTMRAFFSEEFMPSIHYSSFEAADGLREPEQAEDPVIAGFMEQTRNVLVGVRASLERALGGGLVDGAGGSPRGAGHAAADGGGARRPVRARDRRHRGARVALHDPRHRLRRPPPAREVHRQARRHPPHSGLHRAAGSPTRGARDRQH